MNRLQKKCLIVSVSLHLLLVLLILVGPGFMSATPKEENLPEINFVPSMLVDAALAGGGNPHARRPQSETPSLPTPPAPPPPTRPEPKAEPKTREPEATAPVKEAKSEPDSLEPKRTRRRTPNIPTTLKERSRSNSHSRSRSDADVQQQRREAEERRRLARQFASAARSIGGTTSATSGIEDLEFGPGGGGPTYASLAALIQMVYMTAWVPPDGNTVDSAVAYARITIAHDGTVVSAILTTPSGDPQIDASVRWTLRRVTTIGRPFPEGIKDKQRTYQLKFDLRTKRGTA